jgi:hypothetical protein
VSGVLFPVVGYCYDFILSHESLIRRRIDSSVSRPGTIVDAHGEPFLIRADKDAAWSKGTILRQPVMSPKPSPVMSPSLKTSPEPK